MKNFLWRSFLSLVGSITVTAVPMSAFSATSQLPSCTVTTPKFEPVPGDPVGGQRPVHLSVRVDSHGNFHATTSTDYPRTQFDEFGVSSWKVLSYANRGTLRGSLGINYYSASELEKKLCARGKYVAFYESWDDIFRIEYVATADFILPKPHMVVRELANPVNGTYFLSALGFESDFILSGGAGSGWVTTANGFRLPRVAEGVVPVHRFFGRAKNGIIENIGFHFYTADVTEFEEWQRMIASGAKLAYEGVAFLAPKAVKRVDGTYGCSDAQTVPVTRLLKRLPPVADPDRPFQYRYVVDPALARIMLSNWDNQGASFCALPD
jgi:hypothetical protein